MSQHQRSREQQGTAPQGSGPDDGTGLDAVRADVSRLNDVVDRAYARIRSVNSEEYLRQNRQAGGQ